MKKLLSIALALVLILSMSIVASADEGGDTTKLTMTSKSETVTIDAEKVYTLVGTTDTTLYPDETLTFKSTPAAGNPDASANLTVGELKVTGKKTTGLTITVPAFSKAGIYRFTISENPGTTQGVTYTTGAIDISVLVEYDYADSDNDGYGLKVATVGVTSVDESKAKTFTNTYSVGSLNVKKVVSGNLASKTQKFDIDVTFSAKNSVLSSISYGGDKTIVPGDWKDGSVKVTVQLADGEDVTFSNIPDGVTYNVAEDKGHAEKDENSSDPSKGYSVSYTDNTGGIAANETKNAVVTNTKNTSVDTGITMDSMPYVLLLAVACFGMVVLFSKKRMMREN